MIDFKKQLDKADEIEAQFTEINGRIRDIMGLLLEITEAFGLATGELYELKDALADELEEMEPDNEY